MKLQQLRYIYEVARHDLNVSATAESLYTSQPGISKQIRLLEDELGVQVFTRSGKHLTSVTPAGKRILEVATDILQEVKKIQDIAADYVHEDEGILNIAATHSMSRYFLPAIVARFRESYPKVKLHLHQGIGDEVNIALEEGSIDFALVSEADALFSNKILLPAFYWKRCVVVPEGHELTEYSSLSLELLAKQPILTHSPMDKRQSVVENAFLEHGYKADVVFSATDSEILKSYVRMGMGVGIIAEMAYDEQQDSDLVRIPIDEIFPNSLTKLCFHKNLYFRKYIHDFIELVAPHLNGSLLTKAQHSKTPSAFAKQIDLQGIKVY